MHRLLWGIMVALFGQIAFTCWNLWAPSGVGPAYTMVALLQYGGVMAGTAALLLLLGKIRHAAEGRRLLRGTAAAAVGLSGAAALFIVAAMISRAVESPLELDLLGLGQALVRLTWLALVLVGLTALGARPRPVLPALLLGVLCLAGATTLVPVPYSVTGPAGEPDTSYLIRAEGGELHHDRIYGLTVWSVPATVADYLRSLVVPHTALVPESDRPALAVATLDLMMTDSEAMAKAVGLQLVGRGKGATVAGDGPVVLHVSPDTPAAAAFSPGDQIVGFNGAPVATWAELLERLKPIGPGVQVTFDVRRDGEPRTLTLTTVPNPSSPERGMLGFQAGDRYAYDIPVAITSTIPTDVGGPSMGLALTLQIVDQLTPGGITNGWRVAATGTILPDGKVGPIGGVQYKVLGAERVGAGVLFVPRQNYEQALSAATQIQVVPVDSAQDALAWLKAHPSQD